MLENERKKLLERDASSVRTVLLVVQLQYHENHTKRFECASWVQCNFESLLLSSMASPPLFFFSGYSFSLSLDLIFIIIPSKSISSVLQFIWCSFCFVIYRSHSSAWKGCAIWWSRERERARGHMKGKGERRRRVTVWILLIRNPFVWGFFLFTIFKRKNFGWKILNDVISFSLAENQLLKNRRSKYSNNNNRPTTDKSSATQLY